MRFEIALSFPGEKRDFVEGVAEILAKHFGQNKILYDMFHEAEFARPDLDIYLPRLYLKDSGLVVIFLCEQYSEKRWCKLEWRYIRQMLATKKQEKIMYISFDKNIELNNLGFLPGDGYVYIGDKNQDEIARLVIQRYDITYGKGNVSIVDNETSEERTESEPPSEKMASEKAIKKPIFHIGSVVPPDFFIGRERELHEADLCIRNRHSLLVCGDLRIGKTSFCMKLCEEIKKTAHNEIIPIYVNLQSIPQLTVKTLLEHCLLEIIGEVLRVVYKKKYSMVLEDLKRGDANDGDEIPSYYHLLRLFREARKYTHQNNERKRYGLTTTEFCLFIQELGECLTNAACELNINLCRYVLVLDEANKLSNELSSEIIIANEESFVSSGLNTVYVAAKGGVSYIQTMCKTFGNIIELGPFEKIDSLKQLLSLYYYSSIKHFQYVPIDNDAVEKIWKLSNGCPYDIQKIASHAFKMAHIEKAKTVSKKHVYI